MRSTTAPRGGFAGNWQTERAWYLKHERDRFPKKSSAQLEVVLGFPNRYSVGMSNLGFQTVYALLNELEGVRCERTFLWETAGSGTLESGQPLSRFSVVAFSVPFELDETNLLEILHRAQIPLLASHRAEKDPIIVMGGPCAFLNPEPMAPFVDLIVVGEAEHILPPLVEILKEAGSKEEVLEASVRVPGIYVPRYYRFDYLPDGRIRAIHHRSPAPQKVIRQWSPDLNAFPTVSSIVTPLSHLKDMSLLEVQRGCGYRCRFCAMGQIYRPLRHRSTAMLREQIDKNSKRSKRLGLVGSAVADLPGLLEICQQMSAEEIELGISSLRADRLTRELIGELARLGMRTVTIAPEVGSERLRLAIDKSVRMEDVLRAATLVAEVGIPHLKLYFLVGLPWEREEDLAAIVSLVARVRRTPGLKRVSVSVSPFVPKPATPFQWAPMERASVLHKKIRYLTAQLRPLKGVNLTRESPRRALWQGILAMGDRRVGMVLWHHISEGLTWAKAWDRVDLRGDFYVHRERRGGEIFPWDIIDHGMNRENLWVEFQLAKEIAQ